MGFFPNFLLPGLCDAHGITRLIGASTVRPQNDFPFPRSRVLTSLDLMRNR